MSTLSSFTVSTTIHKVLLFSVDNKSSLSFGRTQAGIWCCFFGRSSKFEACNIFEDTWNKGTVFFFSRNSLPPLTHSIFENFVFFFFHFLEKKNTNCFFFFSQEKFAATHSSEERIIYRKKVKNPYVLQFFHILVVFFFPNIFSTFSVFFFPQEKFKVHSLTRFFGPEKNSSGKKKHNFHSLSRFLPKKCKN